MNGYPVLRQVDLGAVPVLQGATPRHPGQDPERASESTHDVSNGPLEHRIPGRDEDRVRTEDPRGQCHMGRDPLVSCRAVPETEDRDHRSILEPDDPVTAEVEAGRAVERGPQIMPPEVSGLGRITREHAAPPPPFETLLFARPRILLRPHYRR